MEDCGSAGPEACVVRLQVEWTSECNVPFPWTADDTVEVSANGTVEDLAAAISAAYQLKAAECAADAECQFQVQLIAVGKSRLAGAAGKARLAGKSRLESVALPYGATVPVPRSGLLPLSPPSRLPLSVLPPLPRPHSLRERACGREAAGVHETVTDNVGGQSVTDADGLGQW